MRSKSLAGHEVGFARLSTGALRRHRRPHARSGPRRGAARTRPDRNDAAGRLRVSMAGFPVLDAVVADLVIKT